MNRVLHLIILLLGLSAAPAFAATLPVTPPPQDAYAESSLQNYSKLYWALGKLDLTKNEDVDNYLLINECELYQRYFNNDIEWNSIREVTRDTIVKKMAEFPTKLEIILPVRIGRYDQGRQEFVLDEKTNFLGMKRMDVGTNDIQRVCGRMGEIPGFPASLLLELSSPFTLTAFPMDPVTAELYIADTKALFSNLSLQGQMQAYERTAYLRLKVHVFQFKETVLLENRYVRAAVVARIDGYEIYADPKKTKLLYKADFEQKTLRRAVRGSLENLNDELSKPRAEETKPTEPAPQPTEPADLKSLYAPDGSAEFE